MADVNDTVSVYEGKEGYALVDELQWRTMRAELARLRDENARLESENRELLMRLRK